LSLEPAVKLSERVLISRVIIIVISVTFCVIKVPVFFFKYECLFPCARVCARVPIVVSRDSIDIAPRAQHFGGSSGIERTAVKLCDGLYSCKEKEARAIRAAVGSESDGIESVGDGSDGIDGSADHSARDAAYA